MRRRGFVRTIAGTGLVSTAGCTSTGNGDPSDYNSSEEERVEYLSEVGFERSDGGARMYAAVSDEVSQINLINNDGSAYRSIPVTTGETTVHLGDVGTFRKEDLEFVILDREGNTIETVTKTFEPVFSVENATITQDMDSGWDDEEGELRIPSLHIVVEIRNTGNSPLFVYNSIDVTGHVPRRLGALERDARLDPGAVRSRFEVDSESFSGLLPGESTTIESANLLSEFVYFVESRSGSEVIRDTDLEWDESEYCQGESRELRLRMVDSSGDEHLVEVPVRFSDGVEVVTQRVFLTGYRCNTFEVE